MNSIPCSCCGKPFPETDEHFPRRSNGKLRKDCRECARKRTRKWNDEHPDSAAEWRANNPEYQKEWYQVNKETHLERSRIRYRANPRKKLDKAAEWAKANVSSRTRYARNYRRRYPEKTKVIMANRKAREASFPATFTATDWNRAATYFNNCCAVCGRQLNDLFKTHTVAADHWIPLSSSECPGTVPSNIIPLCHGLGGCNNKKLDKHPMDWLMVQFGKRKAKQIMRKIVAYFEWVATQ